MDNHLLGRIRARYNTFSSSQQQVADYVLSHADTVMMSSLSDFAKACGVSEPTIMRFLRKLDCDSYQVFRVGIAQELAHGSAENIYEEVSEEDTQAMIRDKVIHHTVRSLEDAKEIIDAAALDHLVEMIRGARRTLVVGIGASSAIAFDCYHKLVRLGLTAIYENDPHMINILTSGLGPHDLMIAITHSGESREILDAAAIARDRGCPVAAVTSYPSSSIARLASCLLLSSSLETRYRSDALTSRIIQMTITDMIYTSLALRLGDSAQIQVDRSRVAVAKNKT